MPRFVTKRVPLGEPFDRQRVCPTHQLPPDAERVNSRRRPFLRTCPQVFASQFGGASACPFAEVALGQGLQAPNDAFDEPGAVAGLGGFAEEFSEALP